MDNSAIAKMIREVLVEITDGIKDLVENPEGYYEEIEGEKYCPDEYACVGHPSRALALRYGIVNWGRIRLKKLSELKVDAEGVLCLAELLDFKNRKVRVFLAHDKRIVKTFYPMNDDWFHKYADIEEVLKDNDAFDLKELAAMHVQLLIESKKNLPH